MKPWLPSAFWMAVLALLLGGGAPAWAQSSIPEQYHRMHPGTMRMIVLPPDARGYAVRDEDMVEIRQGPARNTLWMIALQRGVTEVFLFGPQGPVRRIKVWSGTAGDGMEMICEICKLFPQGSALWIESVSYDQLLVRGTAYTLEEARSVKIILSEYRHISADVQLTERALREGLLRVNHALWSAGFLDARAVVVGNQVELTGRFKSDADESRARATLAPYAQWLEERLGLPILAPAR